MTGVNCQEVCQQQSVLKVGLWGLRQWSRAGDWYLIELQRFESNAERDGHFPCLIDGNTNLKKEQHCYYYGILQCKFRAVLRQISTACHDEGRFRGK